MIRGFVSPGVFPVNSAMILLHAQFVVTLAFPTSDYPSVENEHLAEVGPRSKYDAQRRYDQDSLVARARLTSVVSIVAQNPFDFIKSANSRVRFVCLSPGSHEATE